ncbi:cytochrome P450 [Xylaria arbuscula]|nr:cytochrome P450 [Xylaria arbuscula]
MNSFVPTIAAILLAVYAFAWIVLRSTHDSREPPLVDSWIPFFSPIIAMVWRGLNHWHAHNNLPLYTVRALVFHIYILNSTALIPIVQRRINSISFNPLLIQMSARFMAIGQTATEIIKSDPLSSHGFISGMNKTTHVDLSPGTKLDSLSEQAADVLTSSLRSLASSSTSLKMKQWVTYEAGLLPLLANVLPSFTARKYARAREFLVRAYQEYYSREGHAQIDASAFIANRYKFYSDRGIPVPDIARIEVGAETFRFHGIGVSLRKVLHDETLQGWLLKKDSIAADNSVPCWGGDVSRFDHKRFLRTVDNEKTGKQLNPVAFRGFGGGATLCPGRHFASTEILVFVSLVILKFDIRPLGDYWKIPSVKNSNPSMALNQPDHDLDVELTLRAQGTWNIQFTASDGRMIISAEDMDTVIE